MRTAIGAAERRSHLTFPLVGEASEADAFWRHFSKRLKTGAGAARARACWFCPFVRHRNYKTVPSSFNFWVDWIVFSGAGSKRRVVSQQSKYRTPYEASIASPLTGLDIFLFRLLELDFRKNS